MLITLVPQFVVLHPVLNLLVGHVEIAFLFVESGHADHLLLRQFEVKHFNILLDMLRIRKAHAWLCEASQLCADMG